MSNTNYNANTTNDTLEAGGNNLSPEMKTYYSDYLIDNAVPKLVHDQFGQKHFIPKNGGKQIEFRKYSPLPKLTEAISEGVTPDGQKLNVSTVVSPVKQYGGYVTLTDMLILTAIDNNMLQATKLLGAQAGSTLDTITREVLNGGTSVQYGDSDTVNARYLLKGGNSNGNNYLTVDAIRKAVRYLKTQNAEKIGDSYVAIIHPDVAYDLMSDPAWQNVKTYCDPIDMYEGEIGKVAGVRFVETTEAKIFHADSLTAGARNLSVKTAADGSAKTLAVKEVITSDDAKKLAGRKILIGSKQYTVASATAAAAGSAKLTLTENVTAAADADVYPGEAGANGRDVYSTLILAENAYGVTEVTGGGLQHIVKQLGSGGTEDALNQRATVGWKATKAAERLVEAFMRRIETCSTFESGNN